MHFSQCLTGTVTIKQSTRKEYFQSLSTRGFLKMISAVFEPFYTTKRNGLGLGHNDKRVVEEHGGKVAPQADEACNKLPAVKAEQQSSS
jgi:hypothetical protein